MLIKPSGKGQVRITVGIQEDWTSDHTEIFGYRHVTISPTASGSSNPVTLAHVSSLVNELKSLGCVIGLSNTLHNHDIAVLWRTVKQDGGGHAGRHLVSPLTARLAKLELHGVTIVTHSARLISFIA